MNRDPFPPSIDSASSSGKIRQLSWLTCAAAAMTLSAFAVIIYGSSGAAQNMLLNQALTAAAKDREAGQSFAMTASSSAKILAGISGEALPSNPALGAPVADTELVGTMGIFHEHVAPAGLGHVTANDCITLTTQTGQTISFRIVGAHAGKAKGQGALPQLDLEVTACSDADHPISKAHVEPVSAPVEKTIKPQQNL